jgi:hypothetical protein
MPVILVACQVLQTMVEPYLREASVSAMFLDYGLHRTLELMMTALQERIDEIRDPSVIIFGYGLCGNGLVGLRARHHTLVVPRVDDCIALLLGSYQRYQEEFAAEPGTYYLTPGWLESGSHPLKEYQELVEKYDPEMAGWVLDEQYRNYQRVLFVAPNQSELEAYRKKARQVADFCAAHWDLRYEERLGSSELVRGLLTVAPHLQESTDDFLVISPGGEVQQEMFLRRREDSEAIETNSPVAC